MSTREQQTVALELPNLANDTISSRADLPRRFAPGTAITKQFPLGPFSVNLVAAATLVLTIVPLKQVFFNLGHLSETCQLASPSGAPQWACEHFCKGQAPQSLGEAARVALAALGQRQIRQPGVLPGDAPGSFAVASQIDCWEAFAHRTRFLAT
jgi:hypothetical protein